MGDTSEKVGNQRDRTRHRAGSPGARRYHVRRPHLALLATVIVTLLAAAVAVLMPAAGAAAMMVVPTGAAAARAAGTQAAGTQAAAAARPVRGLVFRGASSPVLRDLRSDLGARLSLTPETPARLSRDHGYGVLVLDGDTITPAALAADRTQLRAYLDSGGWVLALDVDPADFSRAINGLTGFTARPPHGTQSSRAFLFRDTTLKGIPAVVMLDAPSLTPLNANQLSPNARRAATAAQAQRIAALIRTRLLNPNSGLQTPARSGRDVPPYLQLFQWDYSVAGNQAVPAGWWGTKGKEFGVFPPAQGKQTASWVMNHTFDVYLDNRSGDPAHDYQVVTYNLNGEFTPKQPDQKFAYMFTPFQVQGIGNPTYFMERAWWTGIADVSVTPDSGTDANLTWQASAPATPDATTQYSSGDDFSVGFAASPSEGPGFDASYSVSNVTTHTVRDWGVANQTAGNDLAWEFSARNNCDVRPATYSANRCFDIGFLHNQMPNQPNELSLGQLQLATTGRWRTKRLLGDANHGRLTFTVKTPVALEDSYCSLFELGACVDPTGSGANEFVRPFTTGPPPQTYAIDAYRVVPVGIKSVTVSPATADGTNNQPVTGTVTLEHPALIPTTVVIFSDNRNATVGVPTGGAVSRTTVTIDQGQQQATFRILTNANHLPAGKTSTAQITAFYDTPTTTQLRVTAESGG
jgi:hypothetical protein